MIIEYNEYCSILDSFTEDSMLEEGFLDTLKQAPKKIGALLSVIKKDLAPHIEDAKLSIKDIVRAFKNKEVFGILKTVGFSITKLYKVVDKSLGLLSKGLHQVFVEIHKTGAMKKLNSGAITVDEFLKKHPILKKLSGPIVAGLLVLIWLNITFTGNVEYDFNIESMFQALMGNFSIEKLFTSPAGLTALTFVVTNMASAGLLSFSWFGSTPKNIVFALTYTAFKKANIRVPSMKKFIQHRKIMKEDRLPGFKEYLTEELKVSMSQLKELEKMLDKLFQTVGVDIEFTKHFFDRINDARNNEQIKVREVRDLFRKVYAKFKDQISHLNPDFEGVLKDLSSEVNIPFHISWNAKDNELELISKTIMRKKDFKTSNKMFKV